jgi:hypothetical protein
VSKDERHVINPRGNMLMVPYIVRDVDGIENDGTVATLPDPVWVADKGDHPTVDEEAGWQPTIIYRKDIRNEDGFGEWQTTPVSVLRQLLADPILRDDWELWPTPLGNLAICVWGPDPCYPDEGTRWYAGYIDLVAGKIALYNGLPVNLQGLADNYPFQGPFVRVECVDHAETVRILRERG